MKVVSTSQSKFEDNMEAYKDAMENLPDPDPGHQQKAGNGDAKDLNLAIKSRVYSGSLQ